MSTVQVKGTDGIPPVYNPEGRFQVWALNELWFGKEGTKRYVPNVDDRVINTESEEWFRVVSIHPVTLIPTLAKLNTTPDDGGVKEKDLLIGVGPGTISDTFRCYIDKSVQPYTLAVDGRCITHHSDSRYYQIVKGNELDGSLKIISSLYDQSGNYLGTDIPLELANMRDHTNHATWTFTPCTTHEELVDNEVVYCRVFSDNGGLRSKFPLLVENTAYIRLTDTATKYVTHISLDTMWLSTSDPHVVEYPLNVPLRGLNLFGIVHYNDGSTKRMPVDGTKFEVFGFENFVATVVGERTPFKLKYNLSRDEIHYGSTVNKEHFMMENYTAITTKENGSFTVKLFAYPQWIDEINGYRLEFWMLNLDRKTFDKVTPYVFFNTNAQPFNPKLYGINQQISVSIDISKVNPSYKKWIHVQVLDVVLNRHATDKSTSPWTIGYERAQNPPFGKDNWAEVTYIDANLKHVSIKCNETNFDKWLERMYYNTKPLFSDIRESKPPKPNMFAIHIKDKSFEFNIEQWNYPLSVSTLIGTEETIYVRFFKRTPDIDLQLAIAGLPVIMLNTQP